MVSFHRTNSAPCSANSRWSGTGPEPERDSPRDQPGNQESRVHAWEWSATRRQGAYSASSAAAESDRKAPGERAEARYLTKLLKQQAEAVSEGCEHTAEPGQEQAIHPEVEFEIAAKQYSFERGHNNCFENARAGRCKRWAQFERRIGAVDFFCFESIIFLCNLSLIWRF